MSRYNDKEDDDQMYWFCIAVKKSQKKESIHSIFYWHFFFWKIWQNIFSMDNQRHKINHNSSSLTDYFSVYVSYDSSSS